MKFPRKDCITVVILFYYIYLCCFLDPSLAKKKKKVTIYANLRDTLLILDHLWRFKIGYTRIALMYGENVENCCTGDYGSGA